MEREGSKALELGNSIYPKIAVASLLWRLGVGVAIGKERQEEPFLLEWKPCLSHLIRKRPCPLFLPAFLRQLPIVYIILKEQGYLESSLTPFLSVKGKPMP